MATGNFEIRASQLAALGVDPNQWTRLDLKSKARLASAVLRSLGRTTQAMILEGNNPNAVASVVLVWDI